MHLCFFLIALIVILSLVCLPLESKALDLNFQKIACNPKRRQCLNKALLLRAKVSLDKPPRLAMNRVFTIRWLLHHRRLQRRRLTNSRILPRATLRSNCAISRWPPVKKRKFLFYFAKNHTDHFLVKEFFQVSEKQWRESTKGSSETWLVHICLFQQQQKQ